MSNHRAKSRFNTRLAQGAVLLLLAGGTVVILFPRPDPSAKIAWIPAQVAPSGSSVITDVAYDPANTISALDSLLPHAKEPDGGPGPGPGPGGEEELKPLPPPPPPPPVAWRHLGSIMGTTKYALISTHDEAQGKDVQFLLAEGQEKNNVTLVAVHETKLIIREAGQEMEIVRPALPSDLAPSPATTVAINPNEPLPPHLANMAPGEMRDAKIARWRIARAQDAERKARGNQTQGIPPPKTTPPRPSPNASGAKPGVNGATINPTGINGKDGAVNPAKEQPKENPKDNR